jgi:hypothetical protein
MPLPKLALDAHDVLTRLADRARNRAGRLPVGSGQPPCSSSAVIGHDGATVPYMACKGHSLDRPCRARPADRSLVAEDRSAGGVRDRTGPKDAAEPPSRLANDAVVTEDEPHPRSSWEPTAPPCARST